jgi:hypothetical protein
MNSSQSHSQGYVTTDGQSASLSWNKAPVWGLRPDFYYRQTVACLELWGALTDERTGLSITIAAGPRQRSYSRVRVPRDLKQYFTLSDSRLSQHGRPGPRIYRPQEQGDQVIHPRTGFLFHRLIRLSEQRWSYSNPPPWHVVIVRVRVTLRLAVYRQSVRLGANPLRATTSIFPLLNTCGYSPYVTSSLERGWICRLQLLLVLASAVILGYEFHGTHDHILPCQSRGSPNLQVQAHTCPRNRVSQLYPQILNFFFVTPYDSQGYGGGVRHRLHTESPDTWLQIVLIITFRHGSRENTVPLLLHAYPLPWKRVYKVVP